MADNEILFEMDRKFNRYAQENGVAAAFEKFADADAILLRERWGIIQGSGKMGAFLKENMSGTLEWGSDDADIVESGELGYTYGKWI